MADFGIIGGLAAVLSAAGAASGAGLSIANAQAQNKAKKRSEESARTAASVQSKQINEAAALERQKRARESAQIRGRLAAIGSASGADPAGSYAAIDRQADLNYNSNIDILNTNRQNELARVASGLNANLASLSGQGRNPLLDAFSGGASGLGTGLSLYNAIPNRTPTLTGTEQDFFP